MAVSGTARRLAELARRPADPARRGRSYGALDVAKAIEMYAKERRAQVSPRMVAYANADRGLTAFGNQHKWWFNVH